MCGEDCPLEVNDCEKSIAKSTIHNLIYFDNFFGVENRRLNNNCKFGFILIMLGSLLVIDLKLQFRMPAT